MHVVEPANRRWSFFRVGSAMAEAAGVPTTIFPVPVDILKPFLA
jgi:hypothetical protein